jgi:hypothetical protein
MSIFPKQRGLSLFYSVLTAFCSAYGNNRRERLLLLGRLNAQFDSDGRKDEGSFRETAN